MEALVFSSLLGLGYYLNKLRTTATPTSSAQRALDNVSANRSFRQTQQAISDRPSSSTLYDSRFLDAVRSDEVRRATAQAHMAIDPTLRRPRGMPTHHEDAHSEPESDRHPPMIRSSLSDQIMPIEHFTHNNPTPFYRGSPKQNRDAETFTGLVQKFTGTEAQAPKREQAPLFVPQKQDVFGMAADDVRDAYLSTMPKPRNRANETAIPSMIVGRPGIKDGETGDTYYDMRDRVLPKTVDELRTKAQPKATYEGRVLPGAGTTTERMEPSQVFQNRQSTVKELSHDDLFRTTGAFSKERARSVVLMNDTARQDTTREHFGTAAAPVSAARDRQRIPLRATARSTCPTSKNAFGPASSAVRQVTDYGRANIIVYSNERDLTSTRTYQGSVTSAIKAMVAPVVDALRGTKKEQTSTGVEGRAFGNVQPGGAMPPKMTVYDSEDVARTTIKDASLSEAPLLNVRGAAYKLTVYDPEDVARATLKDAGLAEAPIANVRAAVNKSVVYDPEDVTRTTLKQTVIGEAPVANLVGAAHKLTVYDPEDVARTTQKQTLLQDTHGMGSVVGASRKGRVVMNPDDSSRTTGRETLDPEDAVRNVAGRTTGVVYDPDDWEPQTTMKQIVAEAGRGDLVDGNVGRLQNTRGGAYATNDFHAEATHKQYLVDSGVSYGQATQFGNSHASGYLIAPDDIRDTIRQVTSDNDYYGASTTSVNAQMVYDSQRRVNETKELISQGRAPTKTGAKVGTEVGAIGEAVRLDPQRANLNIGDERAPQIQRGVLGLEQQQQQQQQVGTRERLMYDIDISNERLMLNIDATRTQLESNPVALPPPPSSPLPSSQ